jgi:hypothetical protein
MSEVLRECPICKTGQYVYVIPFDGESDKLVCACNVCGASTGACDTEEEAERQWNILVGNRRAEPENKPLTLDELRQMDGEPVWTVITIGCDNAYGCELVGEFGKSPDDRETISMCNLIDGTYDVFADLYGKTWLAYRRKLESEGA